MVLHKNEINQVYLKALETIKSFINVRNCYYAKGTSVNWAAVTFLWSSVQFIGKLDSNKPRKMFYVKESHAFSCHDFFKEFSWFSQFGTIIILETLPDGPIIYECKIFMTEQNVAGVLSPKLMLSAFIQFRPSLQIHTQKILVRVSYLAWVQEHTQWFWMERFLKR